MIVRRIPLLVGAAAAAVAVVAVGEGDSAAPEFSSVAAAEPWMPSAPVVTKESTTWFCPGVPASGEDGTAGEILVANADAQELTVHVTFLGVDGAVDGDDVTVAPQSQALIDVDAAITSPYASAVLEIVGGAGVVEQRATAPLAGGASARSVAACATSTSPNWYLAEGYTAEGSEDRLVLTNPYPEAAVLDVRFATQDGSREPTELQGAVVPPRSVRVLNMAELAARDEPEVAVSVETSRGQLLVARAQTYAGEGRRGYAVSLAAPAARDQWWFADGEVGDGISERYSIYNPGEDEIEVTASLLGIASDAFVPIDPIVVPARQVVTFTPSDVEGMPEGRHSMVFGGQTPEARFVVERAMSRTFDDVPTTSVVLGATSRAETGYVATTWTMGFGVDEPTTAALVVYNVDAQDAVVTVQAVTPTGIVNVPSLASVELPARGLITIDLTDEAALDRQLIVRSTSRVMIERSLPRDVGAQGRVASWPLPAEDRPGAG